MILAEIILGLIVIGCIVAYAVILTIKWLRDKIKKKLARKNTSKVALGDIQSLINEAMKDNTNTINMSELNEMVDGTTHYIAPIGTNGEIVGDIELIEDKNDALDSEVASLLGNKKMVVVEN